MNAQGSAFSSAIYTGWVRHRRFHPGARQFTYPLFMTYLNLADLKSDSWIGKWSRTRIKPDDHFCGPVDDFETAVRSKAEELLGRGISGPICLLTNARQLGSVFNPVSFFYLFDEDKLSAILAEVHNTPWNETHIYPLACNDKQVWEFEKEFHVSPFMDMAQTYTWRLTPPDASLVVHMENFEVSEKVFDATLTLRRRELSFRALAFTQLRFPFTSLRVLPRIYWQAFLLWASRHRYFPHPTKREVQP
ncbi:MAG: DUF1365 domain-containing protein [Armatimonadetes bacterium]|nr:DUF1365 domain-containing protein [Armatimonadota bacterium]